MPDVEEDDLIDELPPLGDLADEEEVLAQDELGIDLDTPEGESVGLDDSTGIEDDAPLFALDLPPAEVREGAGDDSGDDAGVEGIPLAETIGGDDEYGWTVDAGSAADEKWDPGEMDLPKLTPLGRDDTGGAEGVEEVFELGGQDDDSVPHLPPLDESLDADEDEELDLGFGETFGIAPTLEAPVDPLPPPLDEMSVELVLEVAARDVFVGEHLWVAASDGVFRGEERLAAEGLSGAPCSICASADSARLLVGTDAGAFLSSDAGRGFQRIDALGDGPVSFALQPGGPVWACGPTGRLQRSDDFGDTWTPPLLLTRVVAIAATEGGVVTLSAPETAQSQLAASVDGGQRWSASDAPTLERPGADGHYALAIDGADVAVSSSADPGGPHLS